MLKTERLQIIPLTYEQLVLYIRCDGSLEKAMGLNPTNRQISPELKEALEETILPNVANQNQNYLFSTLWSVVLQPENRMVGDLCFIGEPSSAGELEIGYGTYEAFRQKGYMTEAVEALIEWAKKQAGVRSIIASTEKNNAASYRVLLKNRFVQSGETETLYNWRLELTSNP